MKTHNLFFRTILILCITVVLQSCKTALNVAPVQKQTINHSQKIIDFVGFKNTERSNFLIKDFGAELDNANIATDNQHSHRGAFSFRQNDCKEWTTDMRYVAFVEIDTLTANNNDRIDDDLKLRNAGYIVCLSTLFTMFPVYWPMLAASNKNFCELSLDVSGQIYIYDKTSDEFIIKQPFRLNVKEKYKGKYGNSKTDKNAINQRNVTMVHNALLKEFDDIYNKLILRK